MKYTIGDVVKKEDGIFEIVRIGEITFRPYIISNGRDEYFANDDDLILVCHVRDRKDT